MPESFLVPMIVSQSGLAVSMSIPASASQPPLGAIPSAWVVPVSVLALSPAPAQMAACSGQDLSQEAVCKPLQLETAISPPIGDPEVVGVDKARCLEVIAQMDGADATQRAEAIAWVVRGLSQLAFLKEGTLVVQHALKAVDNLGREQMAAAIMPHISELWKSKHGNHVIAKLVEYASLAIIREVTVSLRSCDGLERHQYGCRIVERIIEYGFQCDEVKRFVEELVVKTQNCCKHQYGNFVVQKILECHEYQEEILRQLLPIVPELASNRHGSHVVQKAFQTSNQTGKARIASALLSSANVTIGDLASTKFGSYVVEEVAEERKEVQMALANAAQRLYSTEHGRRVAWKLNLAMPSGLP